MQAKRATIMPEVKNPIFIVTPSFRRDSAGITVLYLLCHYLNLAGENAFIFHYLPESTPIEGLPNRFGQQRQSEYPGGLLAPLATQDMLDFYDQQRLTPIVIYPEIFDNPLNAQFFGRYILNYPGKLIPIYQQKSSFDLAYSQTLADHCAGGSAETADVLFMPTADLNFWNSDTTPRRDGSCYYAMRLQAASGGKPDDLPPGCVEIPGGADMTRQQIREIFRRSELFYCYQDSALAIEAQLCGCPTVFVPNAGFDGTILSLNELGSDGYCIAGDSEGLLRAKATVGNLRTTIQAFIDRVPCRVAELAGKWRQAALSQTYQGMPGYPFEPRIVLFHRD